MIVKENDLLVNTAPANFICKIKSFPAPNLWVGKLFVLLIVLLFVLLFFYVLIFTYLLHQISQFLILPGDIAIIFPFVGKLAVSAVLEAFFVVVEIPAAFIP